MVQATLCKGTPMIRLRVMDTGGTRWDDIEAPSVPAIGQRIQDRHGHTFEVTMVTYVPSGRGKGDASLWDYDYIRLEVRSPATQ